MSQPKIFLFAAILAMFMPKLVAKSVEIETMDLIGYWQGKILVETGENLVVFKVTQDKSGALSCLMDNPQSGSFNVPCNLKVSKEELKIQFEELVFRGHLTEKHQLKGELHGALKQKELVLSKAEIHPKKMDYEELQSLVGTWGGILSTGSINLRLQLHVRKDENNIIRMSIDSVDQGSFGFPVSLKKVAGEYKFQVYEQNKELIDKLAIFTCQLNDGKLEGHWVQFTALPLVLTKDVSYSPTPLLQTPQKPYPYQEEIVQVTNDDDPFQLNGVLTQPQGEGPFPAVLLLGGPQLTDKDGTQFGHYRFLVLADYLTRNGFAVLRYEQRGRKTKNEADFFRKETVVKDSRAFYDWLTNHERVSHVGLISLNDGSFTAEVLANEVNPSFSVFLSPSAYGPYNVIKEEFTHRMGKSASKKDSADVGLLLKMYELCLTDLSEEDMRNELSAYMRTIHMDMGLDLAASQSVIESRLGLVSGPEFRDFLRHNSEDYLKKLTGPVLVLYGGNDQELNLRDNLRQMRLHLKNNKQAVVRQLPGLNHLLQTSRNANSVNYATNPETFSELAMKTMVDWMLQQKKKIERSLSN